MTFAKKSVITCKFFTWVIKKGPIPNFWYTLHAMVANPHSYTYGSSGDTLGEKTEKWPFLSYVWPLTKKFCSGV